MVKDIILFFKRNKLKNFFLILIISIAVLSGILIGSIFKSFADTRLRVSLINESIMNIKNFSNNSDKMDKFLYDLKNNHFNDINIYRFKSVNLSYSYFRASNGNFQTFVGSKDKIKKFLNDLNIKLIDGSLFDSGDLIASKSFLKSNNIWLGDVYKADSNYFYGKELKVSGVLDDSSLIAFIDENSVNHEDTYTSFLILGNKDEFKAIEKSIRSSNFINNNIYIKTPEEINKSFISKYFGYIFQNIMMNILISIIFIFGIIIFFSYFLKDQYKEIFLMNVFGYNKKIIFFKNVFEFSIISIIGWIIGILFSRVFLFFIDKNIFQRAGMFLSKNFSIYIISLIIPLFIIFYILYKVKNIINDSSFNLIKKINIKDKLSLKNSKLIYFKYLQRSGNFRNLFFSNFIFIFLIIFFTALTYSNHQIQLNNIEYFKNKTFITQDKVEEFNNNYKNNIEDNKIIPVNYRIINYKLPFGSQKIYNISDSSLPQNNLDNNLKGYIVLEKEINGSFLNYSKMKKNINEDNYFIIFIGNIINIIIIFISIVINSFIIIKNTISRKKEITLLKIFGFQNIEVVVKIVKEYLFVFITSLLISIFGSYLFWSFYELIFIKEKILMFKITQIYLFIIIFFVFIFISYFLPVFIISKNNKPLKFLK